MSVGIIKDYFSDSLDTEIKTSINKIIDYLEKAGVKVKKVTFPHSEFAIATYYIIADAEASSNLARYDGMRYGYRINEQNDLTNTYSNTRGIGFGDEVRRRILLGTFVLSSGYYDAYYKKAQQVRRLIKEDFENIFKEVDCLITPVTPTTAFKIGEKIKDPMEMYLSDIYTVSANLAGNCALSLPIGYDKTGLPIGMQISAAPFKEENLFKLGGWIEQENNPEYPDKEL
jgi:aspartyl-tRNA(Asn)/glutamyl-tRNA(Gln) amidotransferase subunit A